MGCTTMRSLRSSAGSYTLDKCIAVLLFMPKDKVRIRLITRIITNKYITRIIYYMSLRLSHIYLYIYIAI